MTSINGNSVTNDVSGNLVLDTLNNYIYDAQGRLCAVQNRTSSAATQYVYDASGNRVAKGTLSGVSWPTSGNVCPAPTAANGFSLTATYLYGAGSQVDTELDQPTGSAPAGSWHQNVYGRNGLLAAYTGQNGTAPALYFSMNDWLGTKRVELDTTGRATAYWKSDPYGAYLTQVGSGTDAAENHFTGKERDTESGNDYFGARYYNSTIGRFMSPDWSAKEDPIPYAKLDNPQTLNLFVYVGNNPTTGVDADGHLLHSALEGGACAGEGSVGCSPGELDAQQTARDKAAEENAEMGQLYMQAQQQGQASQQVSQAGQDFIKAWETLSLTVYDASKGKVKGGDWTIGYGHKTMKGAGAIKLSEAEALFKSDVARMAIHVSADLNGPVSQNQFDALVSLRFNSGPNVITPPVSDLNRTGHAKMGDFTHHYITGGGVPMTGLLLRRAAEWRMFSQGVYDASH